MEEREISIVDLMVEVLLHWRLFIVLMALGAVLCGAFSYVRSNNSVKQKQGQSEEIASEPEKWFTDEEMRNVSHVVNYENAYIAQAAYQEKSPFMQIDANNVNRAEATIVVMAEEFQQSCAIAEVYKDIVESGELISKVADAAGIEVLGVSDLLYLDSVDKSANNIVPISNSKGVDTFKIIAVHNEEEKCRAMLESAIEFITEKHSDIEKAMGKHEISVANESFAVVSDMAVANRQKTILSNVDTMKNAVAEAKKTLSDAEQQYYAVLMSDETEQLSSGAESSSSGISIKYVFLGAVMAAFLYAFVLFLIYIFNTKIRATDSLQELYGLSQLGLIPAVAGEKKVLGVVDEWIILLRDHNKRKFSPEEALELAAVAVKMAIGKEALQEVCLMGCGLKERSLDVCGKIKSRLEEEGIRVNILNNVLYDAQMLEELEGTKGAILVESAGSTLYNEIAEELVLLKRQEIKVLGGILVG